MPQNDHLKFEGIAGESKLQRSNDFQLYTVKVTNKGQDELRDVMVHAVLQGGNPKTVDGDDVIHLQPENYNFGTRKGHEEKEQQFLIACRGGGRNSIGDYQIHLHFTYNHPPVPTDDEDEAVRFRVDN
ncbi:hypothetical protein C2W62_09795 [Candidatus Entotheonella serta]|nr:hypothetical protein C2W62_09795 [Candidatus Entotheonella serta]